MSPNDKDIFQGYEIVSYCNGSKDVLVIILKNNVDKISGYKIGEITEGIDPLLEFPSMEKIFLLLDITNPKTKLIFTYSIQDIANGERGTKSVFIATFIAALVSLARLAFLLFCL